MRKILSVIKREYLQVVRTKGFIIGTILGPVFMAAIIFVPVLVSTVSVERQERIGVVDASQEIFMELDKKLDHKLKDGRRRYLIEDYKLPEDIDSLRNKLNQMVLDKELSAYIFIPEDISDGGFAEYVSQHVADFDKIRNINEALNSVIIEKRLKKEGLDPQKIADYMRRVRLKTIKVTKKGVEEDTGGTFIISYFLVLILYMSLFFYGAIILRGVLEEKTSRVVEIILSSLRPFQLMLGKILGIAAVGFTQYIIWALFGLTASQYSGSIIKSMVSSAVTLKIPTIPAYIFVYFVLFFILGYFLYGTIYAAVGSMVNSEKEAQQLLFPVSMFLIIPILLMMYVIRSPNSTFSVVLSLIPFFAPILMLLRICILLPPFIQIAGSIVFLVLAVLLMVWIAAKIYRVGILMYGKRPSFVEILKWVRYK
ncbi:MAG: ABC transporter permease [Candidatus Aminicenantes bacterium]|nr:ABC transporter permease [Candidatus Aminicenantes bacterium]